MDLVYKGERSDLPVIVSVEYPAIGGASQHNSMTVPSPGKWGAKPKNPV